LFESEEVVQHFEIGEVLWWCVGELRREGQGMGGREEKAMLAATRFAKPFLLTFIVSTWELLRGGGGA
jgi:hypothetical protein